MKVKNPRVLHGPFSRNRRHLLIAYSEWLHGVDAHCLFMVPEAFDLQDEPDPFRRFFRENVTCLRNDARGWLSLAWIYLKLLFACDYCKIHFYAGYSFLPVKLSMRRLPWLQRIAHYDVNLLRWVYRIRGKPLDVYVHFQGCEFRTPRQYNFVLEGTPCKDCTQRTGICGPGFIDYKQARSDCLVRQASRVFVATPDLMRDNPKFEYLPQPCPAALPDFDETELKARFESPEEIIILHSPSDPLKKGTRYLEAEVDKILADNPRLRYRRLEGLGRRAVYREMCRSHIFVDQLLIGAYGNALIEAVTRGNLGICKLEKNDVGIANASHVDIGDVLRREIGEIENHPRVVIERINQSAALLLQKHGPENIYRLLQRAYNSTT